jgi:two-component system, cell cycle sensor histidine kinase and response regulator CckA
LDLSATEQRDHSRTPGSPAADAPHAAAPASGCVVGLVHPGPPLIDTHVTRGLDPHAINLENVRFEDLFDLNKIQEIQDAFASATGVASLITDPAGRPITRPSRFCRLCSSIIRKTSKGLTNCIRSDAILGQPNPAGPTMQPCLSGGLWDAGATIYISQRPIAIWLVGQVRNQDLDEARMLAYAREIGADQAEFRAALAEVTTMSTEQFANVAKALFLMANQMSQLAFQNVQQARALQALRESQRMAATLMSNLPGMAYRCRNDPQWTMEFVSEGCRELTGYEPGDLIGNRRIAYADLIRADYRDPLWTTVQAALDSHAPFELTYPIRTADESTKWVWERGRGVHGADGQLQAIEGFVADITQQRHAEEERQRLEVQYRHAQKMEAIGKLAGGVAHDFNNILTAILGHLELARDGLGHDAADDPVAQSLRLAERGAQRAADLTRQLLAFSHRQVSRPATLDLNRTLCEMEKMLRRLIAEDIALDLQLAPDLHRINADVGQVEQVVMNLVVNARDAMPGGGRIVLETADVILDDDYVRTRTDARPGPHVVLLVCDTGHGMDAATMERIFEPFFTTKPVGQGTGLGLATVYGIITQAGGHIGVSSTPRHGATFRVYWPAIDAPPTPGETTAAANFIARGSETVLICEDDASVRALTEGFLRDAGYHVLVADGGQRALERVTEHGQPIDLLLTDVIMPTMDGKRLAELLTAAQPSLRTLYMSGYTADVIANHGILESGVEFLEKPFDRQRLLQRVREVLDQPPKPAIE